MGGRRCLLATKADAGIAVLDELTKTEIRTHLDREGRPTCLRADSHRQAEVGPARRLVGGAAHSAGG